MNDTINIIGDTVTELVEENAQVVSNVSEATHNFAYMLDFWGYWFPCIILIFIAIFFRAFIFTNPDSFSKIKDSRDKTKDVRFRNIYSFVIILIAFCHYANWVLLGMFAIISIILLYEDYWPFMINEEKFINNRLMNFLFNGDMEHIEKKTYRKKEEPLKDI